MQGEQDGADKGTTLIFDNGVVVKLPVEVDRRFGDLRGLDALSLFIPLEARDVRENVEKGWTFLANLGLPHLLIEGGNFQLTEHAAAHRDRDHVVFLRQERGVVEDSIDRIRGWIFAVGALMKLRVCLTLHNNDVVWQSGESDDELGRAALAGQFL